MYSEQPEGVHIGSNNPVLTILFTLQLLKSKLTMINREFKNSSNKNLLAIVVKRRRRKKVKREGSSVREGDT